ncbi:MAG: cytochrome c biogenesis protein ResB [Bacteroidales bacterium]
MAGQSEGKQKSIVEEVVISLAVLIAGVGLQLILGNFNKAIIAFPVNLLIILAVGMLFFIGKGRFPKVAASGSLSVILLSEITIIAILMGLIPENTIKNSWPFALLWLMIMINLTAVLSQKIKRDGVRDIAFLLNHAGLLILMFASGPGSADKSRYFMRVNEGGTEWRAQKSGGISGETLIELPVAITLDDFHIDEYPPKIAIINRMDGTALPAGKPLYIQATEGEKGEIDNKIISVDSILYKPRFAPAAYITISEKESGQTIAGWVSCGNSFQPHKTLNISDQLCAAMTFPEPESFNSKVVVYTKNGLERKGVISVNHPMTAGSWKIYQHSYDNQMGKDSEWSVFELVYDPWFIPALAGMVILMAGAVLLIWKGGKS